MQLGDGQAVAGVRQAQDGEVQSRVRAFHGGRQRPPVREGDAQGAGASDDVFVGYHAAAGVEDDAATLA